MSIRLRARNIIGCTARKGGGKVRSIEWKSHWALGKHVEVREDWGVL